MQFYLLKEDFVWQREKTGSFIHTLSLHNVSTQSLNQATEIKKKLWIDSEPGLIHSLGSYCEKSAVYSHLV